VRRPPGRSAFPEDRSEKRLRFAGPPVEEQRQAVVDSGGRGIGKPAGQLQRQTDRFSACSRFINSVAA